MKLKQLLKCMDPLEVIEMVVIPDHLSFRCQVEDIRSDHPKLLNLKVKSVYLLPIHALCIEVD